ncbi:MAG: pentapeptide repeat-containing protein [Snowella sp.]|nr:pentapeptide repeat-containing protein [Snowella sp.]
MTLEPDSQTNLNSQERDRLTNIQPALTENLPIPIPPRSLSKPFWTKPVETSDPWLLLTAVGLMAIGLVFNLAWLGFTAAIVALMLALQVILPSFKSWILRYLTVQERRSLIGSLSFILAIAGIAKYIGFYDLVSQWLNTFKYDEFGSWAEWVGALGQIMIAVLAVYVAWQQYVISKDLTIQQNRITQQQTIDAYFQGISDLALNDEGMLEDWPQERAFAEGRTAAILSSVDSNGKAKILRFLSQSKLLSPIRRDHYLGRPIFDGLGGYQEDRAEGIRVISLGVMLVAADLSEQDLRWVDLSDIYLIRANLAYTDLVKANLSRTVLYEANLENADLKGTRLFYGSLETATPRDRGHHPNYETGERTGTVIENANFRGVKNMSEEQRCYCCAWGGENTRKTIPGGCEGIPNKLGR